MQKDKARACESLGFVVNKAEKFLKEQDKNLQVGVFAKKGASWTYDTPSLRNDERQQPVATISEDVFFSVPWGHHLYIISQCKDVERAVFYQRMSYCEWDINTDNGTITVNRTIERIYIAEGERKHTELVINTPKTKNSYR